MPKATVTNRDLLKAVNRLAGEVRQLRRDTTAARDVADVRAVVRRLALTNFRSQVFRLREDVLHECCARLLNRREDIWDVLAWVNRQRGQRVTKSAIYRFATRLRETARELQSERVIGPVEPPEQPKVRKSERGARAERGG
jgi:hypothetical protein